ncbi:MAG: hypothetical protein PHT07_02710 [Paludibacter sp.]|nr:hypothetical protein [Paludibacter sp.]
MKKYIISSILLLLCSCLFAQGIYNNGARIAVGIGSYLTIGGSNGNLLNETTGSVDLYGTLILSGNLTNNLANADVFSTVGPASTVILNGATPQALGGVSSFPLMFQNLTINNASGINLLNNVQMLGNLTFSTGLLNLGNSNFTFGPLSAVVGVPSPSSMIYTSGTGQVQKVWSGTGAFTFPIGNNATEYSPVSLNFTSGTFAPGAVTGVKVVNTKYNDPLITGAHIDRYWNVNQTGITAFTCDANFQYLPSDVFGTESSLSSLRVVPTPFTTYNPADVVLHQLSATGLTSFGTFTGASTDKTLNINSLFLEGLYNGAGTMRQAMGVSLPQWPAGVADHITVELHDATTYATIVYSAVDVPLSTTGTATVLVPANFSGSYYITIKHRNSLQTVSATAQSFASNVINQSFGLPANVFGGNLVQMTDLSYTIYSGDVNQDNIIDLSDSSPVDNQAAAFSFGYLPEDINGDGLIDLSDASIIDNNVSLFVGAMTP